MGAQLREELIRAAIELLEEPQVVNGPSLREIARATGIAPSAVYTRFASASELLQTVIDTQYQALRDEIRESGRGAADPRKKLVLIAARYISWGLEHPGSYQLLFESSDKLPEGVVALGPGVELLREIGGHVAEVLGESDDSPERVTLRLWAALHGITSLRLHKKNSPWSTSVEIEAEATVDAFLARA
jgi:AcrR family transcriptional regulator